MIGVAWGTLFFQQGRCKEGFSAFLGILQDLAVKKEWGKKDITIQQKLTSLMDDNNDNDVENNNYYN